MKNTRRSLRLADEQATTALGEALARAIEAGTVVYLCGELGAGKTTLARALLHARGVTGRIKSPTYALVEVYTVSKLNFYHFDFYRFNRPAEWREAGFHEHFRADSICLIEWPERAGNALPPADLRVDFVGASAGRDVEISAHSERGLRCLARLAA